MLIFDEFTVPGELFEVRRTLEGQAAALRRPPQGDRRYRRDGTIAGRVRRILELSESEFVELDIALHQAVAKASKNGLLSKLYGSLEPLLVEYCTPNHRYTWRREHAHNGHVAIVEAIVAGRARDARTAAVAHIRDVEEDIMKF